MEGITMGMLTFQIISLALHMYHIKNSTCSIKNLFGCFSAEATIARNQQPSQEMEEAPLRET